MTDENVVYVGSKNVMNYVQAVITQFNKGSETVEIKARGRSISKAVDVAEITVNRFLEDREVGVISIGTDTLEDDKGKTNVSKITIPIS